MRARAAFGCCLGLVFGGGLACNGSRLTAMPTSRDGGGSESAPEARGLPEDATVDGTDGGDARDGGLVGVDPTLVALPVCASFGGTGSTLPELTPSPAGPGGGWGTGSYVFALVAPTTDGWTLSLASGPATALAQSVSDPGNLLAGLGAGDRISVDSVVACQSFSGCKHYDVVRNAADGTLIAASYIHDSAIGAFADLLGTSVSFEPVCRAAGPDVCFPGALDVENQLRFAGNPTPIAADASGSIVIGGQTVRVVTGGLLTVSGGDGRDVCVDVGPSTQAFWLAR